MSELDQTRLAGRVSSAIGMEFRSFLGTEANGDRWVGLAPAAVPKGRAFNVRVQATWRRLRLSFEPQKFAGELIAAMGTASEPRRAGFRAILEESVALGATVRFSVNGHATQLDDQTVWERDWRRLDLGLSTRLEQLDQGATVEELDLVCTWTQRFVAAVLAISPVEARASLTDDPPEGFKEGAPRKTCGITYERDRRNRAAAIAIHGTACSACGLEFGVRYGQVAEGFIEVHHTRPLSSADEAYIVNPVKDLIPLCPNCHAVAHRRNPPLTVEEIKDLLA